MKGERMRQKKRVETHRQPVEYETKMVGIHVPLSIHREFVDAARDLGLSQRELLKKLIVQHLDQRINAS